MQSTFIKIKFTPLIRYLQNDNTKCCLEIMPDVSCIENLDKIQWKEKNNIVEYSVPVTYKIILKKDTDKEQDKIYYSCIDLRHLSTNSSLACGDITRVVSDQFVLHKLATEFEKNVVLSKPNKLNERKIESNNKKKIRVGENVMKSDSRTREINGTFLETPKKGENGSENDTESYSNQEYLELIDHNKPLKQICIESTVSKETITELSEFKTNQNKKLKLMVTSICTLNTIDSASEIFYKERINNNSKMCIKYNQETRVEHKINEINELFSINTLLYNEYSKSKKKKCKEDSYERILPDMRVAHFMRTVENEILPLKILLSEIYRKCASLGLLRNSNVLQIPHRYGIPHCADKREFPNKNRRKPKCNRVVYSIVFEE